MVMELPKVGERFIFAPRLEEAVCPIEGCGKPALEIRKAIEGSKAIGTEVFVCPSTESVYCMDCRRAGKYPPNWVSIATDDWGMRGMKGSVPVTWLKKIEEVKVGRIF